MERSMPRTSVQGSDDCRERIRWLLFQVVSGLMRARPICRLSLGERGLSPESLTGRKKLVFSWPSHLYRRRWTVILVRSVVERIPLNIDSPSHFVSECRKAQCIAVQKVTLPPSTEIGGKCFLILNGLKFGSPQ